MDVRNVAGAATTEQPRGWGRVAVDVGLSIGTGIVADQIRRSAVRSGNVAAALAGLAGGAAIKAVAEGGITVGTNLAAGRNWSEGLTGRMTEGLRTGAIDSGLAVAGHHLHGQFSRRLPQWGVVRTAAATGTVLGGAGGVLERATNAQTWRQGVRAGLTAVTHAGAWGAAGGLVIGSAVGALGRHLQRRADIRAITTEPAGMPTAVRGGLRRFSQGDRVQGSDVAGGSQPSFLIDLHTPEMVQLRAQAQAIGANPALTKSQRITQVANLVNENLRFAQANKPEVRVPYDQLNARFRGTAAPIGEYVRAGVADCRGFAALNQVLLQEAGVPSYYTYIQEFKHGRYIWDHAINVTFEGKQPVVVDALFRNQFDRMPLQQMLSAGKDGVVFGTHPTLPFVYREAAENVPGMAGALLAMPRLWAARSGAIAAQAREQAR